MVTVTLIQKSGRGNNTKVEILKDKVCELLEITGKGYCIISHNGHSVAVEQKRVKPLNDTAKEMLSVRKY